MLRKHIVQVMLIAALLSVLASCKAEPSRKDSAEAPSSGEIIKKYADTLTTAPEKARDAAEAAKDRAQAEEKALKEIENGK